MAMMVEVTELATDLRAHHFQAWVSSIAPLGAELISVLPLTGFYHRRLRRRPQASAIRTGLFTQLLQADPSK